MDDRTPPARVRLARLQEAHLPQLQAVDAACAAQYHEAGFDAAEVPVRSAADIAHLSRYHNVHVVEADWKPAGYTAWRDEAPGVAYVEEMNVHPDFQRFGLGSRLMAAIRDDARAAGIGHVVVRVWERAPWAIAFYRKLGFVEIEADAPAPVRHWRDEKLNAGRPLTRSGETLMWQEVGPAPIVEEEEEEAPTSDG